MNKIKYKQTGISFIEVMVSSVVLAMIFLWISDTHLQGLSTIADSNDRSQVTWIVEDMVERIKINPTVDLYKNEINSVDSSSSYCSSRENCLVSECTSSEIVKYDVQQIFCNNLDKLSGVSINFECFDILAGTSLNSCSTRGILRGRFSVSWDPKNIRAERLSSYSDALLVGNHAMRFNGGHLEINGNLLGTDFTVAMWVRVDNRRGWRGVYGRQDSGTTPIRAPSLWISPNQGLHWDSFSGAARYGGITGDNSFFSAGDWTHVIWVKKGTSYHFYKNGVLSHTEDGIIGTISLKTQTWIGSVDVSFSGELDDIQVYSEALSVGDIGNVMKGRRVTNRTRSLYIDFEGDNFNDAIADKSGFNRAVVAKNGLNEDSRTHAIR